MSPFREKWNRLGWWLDLEQFANYTNFIRQILLRKTYGMAHLKGEVIWIVDPDFNLNVGPLTAYFHRFALPCEMMLPLSIWVVNCIPNPATRCILLAI